MKQMKREKKECCIKTQLMSKGIVIKGDANKATRIKCMTVKIREEEEEESKEHERMRPEHWEG